MRFPAVNFQIGLSDLRFTADLCRRIAFERSVKTVVVIVILECFKLSLQIDRIPEQRLVKKLSTNSPDQAFDEWVHPMAFKANRFTSEQIRGEEPAVLALHQALVEVQQG